MRLARWTKLILIAACALLPLQAAGQAPAKIARVGVFYIGDKALTGQFTNAFIAGMAARGYTVGTNLVLDVRHSGNEVANLDATAQALVATSDVVFAPSGTAALYARKHGPKVPIVFAFAVDPVGQGLARTLAQPGGMTTGLTIQSQDVVGKRLGVLREVFPSISRVGVLRPSVQYAGDTDAANRAASILGIALHRVVVKGSEDLDAAFEEVMRSQPQALTLADTPLFTSNRQRIVDLAARYRIPVIYGHPDYVNAGGLMSYGAERVDLARRAAVHVDKILKGAKPGDIPIEQPVKFELGINAKTAKALGIQIPQSLLLRADKVID